MKKRITSFILMLTLLLGLIPAALFPAAAASFPYDASISDEAVYVGGIKMEHNKYLPVGVSFLVDEKPEGGYAYLYDNHLTLYNYEYSGDGFTFSTTEDQSAVIFCSTNTSTVSVGIYGKCSLTNTKANGYGIAVAGNVETNGYGILDIKADLGIIGTEYTNKNNGGVNVTAKNTAIQCDELSNTGKLTVSTPQNAIMALYALELDGTVEIDAGKVGIFHANPVDASHTLTVKGNVSITAGSCAIDTPAEVKFVGNKYLLTATATESGAVAVSGDLNVEAPVDSRLSFGASESSLTTENATFDPMMNLEIASAAYLRVSCALQGESGYPVTVAGVTMKDGDYLKNNTYVTTREKPAEGGYAYYKDGVLTLHDYRHVSPGVDVEHSYLSDPTALIISKDQDLTVILEGESYLENTSAEEGFGLFVDEGNLNIVGDGKLSVKANLCIFNDDKKSAVEDANLELYVKEYFVNDAYGIYSDNNITFTNASITVSCEDDKNYEDAEVMAICADYNKIYVSNSKIVIGKAGDGTAPVKARGIAESELYIESSEITITDIEYGIDDLILMENSTLAVSTTRQALELYYARVVDSTLNISSINGLGICGGGESHFENCSVTVSGKDRLLDEGYNSFVNCKLKLSTDDEVLDASDIMMLCYNSDVEMSAGGTAIVNSYGSVYHSYGLWLYGGSLTVTAGNKMAEIAEDIRICGTSYLASYGNSAESLSASDVPLAANAAIPFTNEKYAKLTATKPDAMVTLAGVELLDGQYLTSGSTPTVTVTKPEGGYAYFKDSVLTLHDFTYEGSPTGSAFFDDKAYITSYTSLTLNLEGESSLSSTSASDDANVYILGDLTVKGSGSLRLAGESSFYVEVGGDLALLGGTLRIEGEKNGEIYVFGNATLTVGTLELVGECHELIAEGDLTLNGATVQFPTESGEIVALGSMTLQSGKIAAQTDVYVTSNAGEMKMLGAEITSENGEINIGGIAALTVESGTYRISHMFGGKLTVNGGELELNCIYADEFVMNGGKVTVRGDDSTGIECERSITVNGGELTVDCEGGALSAPKVSLLGGRIDLKAKEYSPFYDYISDTEAVLKVSNCYLTARGFMMTEPDLSDFAAYTATYSQKFDGSEVKPYEGDFGVCSYYFNVTPAGSVSFNAGGGSGEMATVNELSGSVALPECTFTAPTGKLFKGWSLSENGELLADTVYVDGAITLYAIWEDDPNYTLGGTTPGGTTPGGTTPGGTDNPDDPNNGSGGSDENDGLGTGAIIGIVLGSLAVLGGGGFALYWFVLRKKKLTAPVDPASVTEEPTEAEETTEAEDTTEANDEEKE